MDSDLHSKGGKYVVGFVVAGRISRLKNAHCLESLIVCLGKKGTCYNVANVATFHLRAALSKE